VFAELVDILEPLEVQLPSQLLHSPHLSLQREQRKRKQQIWDNSSGGSGATKKTKEERSFYNRLADVQLRPVARGSSRGFGRTPILA